MGSNFFKSALDPLGGLVGRIAGPNSFLAKTASHDPIVGGPVGKVLNPNMYANAQAYRAATHPVTTQGPYAGVTPTLAMANAGYPDPYAQPQPKMPAATPAPAPRPMSQGAWG